MPKYKIQKTDILRGENVYPEGSEIELTEKEAQRLSDFLIPVETQKEDKKTAKTEETKSSSKKTNSKTETKEDTNVEADTETKTDDGGAQ
jgi:hypothetical protein